MWYEKLLFSLKRKKTQKLLEETVSYPIYTENSILIVLNTNNKKASAYASYKIALAS